MRNGRSLGDHIRDHRFLLALLGVVLALVATEAWAAVLYKLTDDAGRVTYADAVPRGFDGMVQRLDIDTSPPERASRAPEDTAIAQAMRRYEEIVSDRVASSEGAREARIRQARVRVANARNALVAAQEGSTAEDWIYFGPGRGRAPRPEYEAKLQRLQDDVARAQADLEAAERG